jgi:hypothetical protein
MKLNIQRLMLFIFLLTINSSALCQGYLSKFVPLDFSANTRNFIYEDGEYIISSINFIDDVSTSTIIRVDEKFDTIETINYSEVFFGRMTPQRIEDKYFAYASDKTQNSETHLLIEMDKDFIEVKRDTFYPEGETFNANGMTVIGDNIVGSAWDYYDCDEHTQCTSMNYKMITTEGKELLSFNVDNDEPYFFSFEVDHTDDEGIIFGGNSRYDGTFAMVYKSDLEGNILWKNKSTQKQSRGNVPVYVEELSNGNIVYTDIIDKTDDDEYIEMFYARYPSQLVWLSAEGDSLFSFSYSEFWGLEKGNGDYFFAYGNEQYNIESDQENLGMYGFLMKFTNEGELLWRRRYKQSNYPLASPLIRHIIEHENGDISMLGREANVDGFFMWMLRVNEHGCFGDEDCDMPMVLPTEDLRADEGNAIEIYPNPAASYVTISSIDNTEINQVILYDIQGQILKEKKIIGGSQLDIRQLDQGLYFLKLEISNGDTVFKKLLIKR